MKSKRRSKFRFKEFKVYQDSRAFCKFCRKIIKQQIERQDRGLADQIQRSLNSIVLNIEGSADNSDIEFARFLGISTRSVYETVAGFDLALSYELITEKLNEKIEDNAHQLVKQLSGFRNSLRSTKVKG